MKKIGQEIWGASGTFAFDLSAVCRGEYRITKPWFFTASSKPKETDKTINLDGVGQSLLALISDLSAKIDELRKEARDAAASATRRLRKSRRLADESRATKALEDSRRVQKQKHLLLNLLHAYLGGSVAEFANGQPAAIEVLDSGHVFYDANNEQTFGGVLPQNSLARQLIPFFVRIVAGNDDPSQTGIVGDLRAFRQEINEVEAAKIADSLVGAEAVGQIEDLALRRISALIDTALASQLPIEVTLANLERGSLIDQAKEVLSRNISTATDLFWELVNGSLDEDAPAQISLREDWAIVATPKDESESSGLAEFIFNSPFGQMLPPELSAGLGMLLTGGDPIEVMRWHARSCDNPQCAIKEKLAEIDRESELQPANRG